MTYFRPINRELPSTKFQLENNIFFSWLFLFLSFLLFFCNAFSTMIFFFLFHFFICLSNLCLFFITPFKMFFFCLSVCFGSPVPTPASLYFLSVRSSVCCHAMSGCFCPERKSVFDPRSTLESSASSKASEE
jgi:hypothetical protein